MATQPSRTPLKRFQESAVADSGRSTPSTRNTAVAASTAVVPAFTPNISGAPTVSNSQADRAGPTILARDEPIAIREFARSMRIGPVNLGSKANATLLERMLMAFEAA